MLPPCAVPAAPPLDRPRGALQRELAASLEEVCSETPILGVLTLGAGERRQVRGSPCRECSHPGPWPALGSLMLQI